MNEITVRSLTEDDWEEYRDARLTALKDSPDAFAAGHGDESDLDDALWRTRMTRSQRLVAERDGRIMGIASVGQAGDTEPEASELFGLWVAPEARGTGVATELVRAGARVAVGKRHRQLFYWVGTDNGRAVAFASGFGFRPTTSRRPMRVVSEEDGEEEIAMVLPLGGDQSFLR